MPKLQSKVKSVSSKPKEPASLVTSSPIEAVFEADLQARYKVAEEYNEHGETGRCFYHPVDGSLLGLGSVNDRLLKIGLVAAKKNVDSIRWTVEQIMVFTSEAEDDTNGKMFIKIQGNLRHIGQTGDNEGAHFDIGVIQKPIWKTKVVSYDSVTGHPIEKITTLDAFREEFIIPYSIDLAKGLSKHFKKCSFILREGNKKWTISQDQFLSGDFETALAHVKPKVARQDGSAY